MSHTIIWSIKNPENIQLVPINSWTINLLKLIDDLIPRFGIFQNIPTIGGDIYDFSSKGLLKFILDKIHNRYDEKAIDLRIIHVPMTLILDAELSKDILLSKNVKRGKIYERFTDFFGGGIFTSNIHEKWHHQRRTIFRLFQRKTLEEITPMLAENMFKVLDEKIKSGQEIELQVLLSQMGLVAFCRVIFGVDVFDTYMDFMDPLNKLLAYMNGAVEPFIIKLDPSYQEFSKNKELLHSWIRKLINEAKENPECNYIIKEELNRNDVTETETIEFILSLVFAGHETTAKLMLAIIYHLYYNQNCVDKMNSETKEYLKTHSQYQMDIIRQPYLKNIIKEGTRLYPSAWIIAREAQEDLEFGELTFKKGAQFLISPLIFLRSEKIWGSDAEVFNPDRFNQLPDQARKTFLPFVTGIESCPGKIFAELETSIVISKLFCEYQLKFLDHTVTPNSAVTLRLTDRLPVIIRKKN